MIIFLRACLNSSERVFNSDIAGLFWRVAKPLDFLLDFPLAVLLLVDLFLLQVLSERLIDFFTMFDPSSAFHQPDDIVLRDVAWREEVFQLVRREELVAVIFEELCHLFVIDCLSLGRERHFAVQDHVSVEVAQQLLVFPVLTQILQCFFKLQSASSVESSTLLSELLLLHLCLLFLRFTPLWVPLVVSLVEFFVLRRQHVSLLRPEQDSRYRQVLAVDEPRVELRVIKRVVNQLRLYVITRRLFAQEWAAQRVSILLDLTFGRQAAIAQYDSLLLICYLAAPVLARHEILQLLLLILLRYLATGGQLLCR